MAFEANITGVGEQVASVEEARLIIDGLGVYMDALVLAGVSSRRTDNKQIISRIAHTELDLAEDCSERNAAIKRRDEVGYINSFELRRDTDTGQVTYARIDRKLPARFSYKEVRGSGGQFRADSHVTRLLFPASRDARKAPRVVLDTWRSPVTRLTEMLMSSNGDMSAHAQLRKDLFERTNSAGVPVAAQEVKHFVLGGRSLTGQPALEQVNAVVTGFGVAVHNEVMYQSMLSAEIAGGRR